MARWRAAAGFIALLCGVAALVSCRQIIGLPDDQAVGPTTTACGLPYGTASCASCANTSCCTQSGACDADLGCRAYQTCLASCTGDSIARSKCRTQCVVDHPTQSPAVSAISACLASECTEECGLSCGGIPALLTPPDASPACESCFESGGECAAAKACAASPDCDAYARCFISCPPAVDCQEACAAAHDAGAGLFAPVWQGYSTATACAKQCAYGNNWNCVGRVAYPAPDASSLTVTIQLVDTNVQPATGIHVDLAYAPPFQNGSLLSSGVTDDAGMLALDVTPFPDHAPGKGLGQPFQGWLQFTSPDIIPEWAGAASASTQARDTWKAGLTVSGPAWFAEQLQARGIAQDPSRAWLIVAAQDCFVSQSPDVRIDIGGTLDVQTVVSYYLSTSDAGTSSNGIALILNVPVVAGAPFTVVSLTATPAALGAPSSVFPQVFVQGGTVTFVALPPTP